MAFSCEFGNSVETILKSDLLSIGWTGWIGKFVVVSNKKSVVVGGGGGIVVVSIGGGGTVVGAGGGGGTVVGGGGGGGTVVGGGGGGGTVVGGGGGGAIVVGTGTVVKGRVNRDGPVVAGAIGIGFCLKLKSKKFPLTGSAGSGAPFVLNPNAFAKCWKNKLIVRFGRSSLGAAVQLNTTNNNTVNTFIFILLTFFLLFT